MPMRVVVVWAVVVWAMRMVRVVWVVAMWVMRVVWVVWVVAVRPMCVALTPLRSGAAAAGAARLICTHEHTQKAATAMHEWRFRCFRRFGSWESTQQLLKRRLVKRQAVEHRTVSNFPALVPILRVEVLSATVTHDERRGLVARVAREVL